MTTIYALLLLAAGLYAMRPERTDRPSVRAAGPMSGRELAGLVSIDYTPDLVLVSPREVELPYCAAWDLNDVMDTLVEIDAL